MRGEHQRPRVLLQIDEHVILAGVNRLAADLEWNLRGEPRRGVGARPPDRRVGVDELAVCRARPEDVLPSAQDRTSVVTVIHEPPV